MGTLTDLDGGAGETGRCGADTGGQDGARTQSGSVLQQLRLARAWKTDRHSAQSAGQPETGGQTGLDSAGAG